MRKPAILAAILVSLAVLTAASPASAMYHPTVGRWVQRDPGPGGMMAPRTDTAGAAAAGEFLALDSTEQYHDGMDLYAAYFVPNSTDWMGLGGGSIEREWPSQIPRNITIDELKKQLRCATGEQKAALAKAKKLLQQYRPRISGKNPGRLGGRGAGPPVLGVAFIILTSTNVADAAEISKWYGASSDDCVICNFRQVLQVDPRPEGLGHVVNFLLDLTVGEPEGFADYTGVEFNVLMSSKECADLDGIADFLDKDTGQTRLGYRAYMSQYYVTSASQRLSQEACHCACKKE